MICLKCKQVYLSENAHRCAKDLMEAIEKERTYTQSELDKAVVAERARRDEEVQKLHAVYKEQIDAMLSDEEMQDREVRRLREVLEFIQWRGHNQVCPVCHGSKGIGHGMDCNIGRSLGQR